MVIIGKYNYYIRSFPTEINENNENHNNETEILKEDKTQKISFLSWKSSILRKLVLMV